MKKVFLSLRGFALAQTPLRLVPFQKNGKEGRGSLRALLIIIFLLNTAVLQLYAQQMQFDRLTTREGLPSNETFSLLQDKKGYIWICTNYGIVKYNGSSFLPVCTNIPFSEQFAFCMYEHPVHGLFFANSHANVYRIKNDSAFVIKGFERVSKKLDSYVEEVSKLYVDDSLNIYIFTKGQSFKLQKKKGYKELYLDSAYVPAGTAFVFMELNGDYFPLVNKHMSKSEHVNFKVLEKNGKHTAYHMSFEAPNNKPRLAHKTADALYVCKDNLLIRLDPDGSCDTTRLPGHILSITSDKQNNIWAGCYNKGMYKIEQGRIIQQYFEGISINSILFDDQDGLWVSSMGKGLYHCRNIHTESYWNIPGLDQRILFIKPIGSSLFVCASDNRLFRIREGITEEITLPVDDLFEITDIIDAPGGYMIATKGGLLTSDKEFRQVRTICSMLPIYGLSRGGKGLYYMNRAGVGLLNGCNTVPFAPAKVNSIIHSRNDELMAGTENGLYLVKDSIFSVPPFLEAFKNVPIKMLKRSADGRIWVCTKGNGLFFIDRNMKAIQCAAPGKIVNDVCFPGDTMIAVCCNNGNFIASLRNAGGKDLWLPVSRRQSLTIAHHNDLLFLGTEDGLVNLDPRLYYNNIKGQLYLAKIEAAGKTINTVSPAFLYDQNSPAFTFEYLDYKDIDRKLRYRLTGAENRSGLTEGMKLRLDNLAAGSYSLTVSPNLRFQRENQSLTLRFTVESPYWEKWWFMALIAAGIMGLISGIALLVHSRVRAKAHKKAEISRMIAEHRLTALKAQINPHFMSNSLLAIQMLITMNETGRASEYLASFSLFIRRVLTYSDKQLITIAEELEITDLYIALEVLRFNDALEFRKEIDPSVDLHDLHVPPLILQPFVENAISHGLLPLRGKRKPRLTISISRHNNVLVITIEDNGVGRKSRLLEVKKGHDSKGNEIMQKRLEHINLLMGVSSANLEIEDLEDSMKNRAGTRVIITLPCHSNEDIIESGIQSAAEGSLY